MKAKNNINECESLHKQYHIVYSIAPVTRHSSVAKVSQDYCETMRPRLVSRDCNTNARLSKI